MGFGNVISGNGEYGIQIFGASATGTRVEHNHIGLGELGANVGNGRDGVRIEGASESFIGGFDAGTENIIAYNGVDESLPGNGVTVIGGTGNRILRNEIAFNDGLGIDLDNDGVTPNDALDLDKGANKLQNFPVYNVSIVEGNTVVEGFLLTTPFESFRLEFFDIADPGAAFSQGGAFLGHLDIDSGFGLVFFSVDFAGAHPQVSATATDAAGNTSEFFQTLIHSIEVTQAIQEWQTLGELKSDLQDDGQPPVPIVANKRAMLRIYAREVFEPLQIDVLVHAPPDLIAVFQWSLSPGCTPEMRRRGTHNCKSTDILFVPPSGEWTLDIRTEKDGLLLSQHEFTFVSVDTKPIVLDAASVCDTVAEDGSWECEDPDKLAEFVGLLKELAPTPNVQVISGGHLVRRQLLAGDVTGDGDLDDCTAQGCEPDEWWHKMLIDLYVLNRLAGSPSDQYKVIYGMTRPLSTEFQGLAYPGLPAGLSMSSATRLSQEAASEIVAHEVGHTLRRTHTQTDLPPAVGEFRPGCDNLAESKSPTWPYADNTLQSGPPEDPQPEVGYDVGSKMPKIPEGHFDVLSYCFPAWIAPHNYVGMLEFLKATAGGSPAMIQEPHWLMSGRIEDGAAVIDPIFEMDAVAPVALTEGTHRLELRDADGAVLETLWFTPVSAQTSTTGEDVVGPPTFVELVPIQAAAARIVLLDKANVELASIELTGTPPTVTCTFPVGGETLSGLHTLTWTVDDPDSANHTFKVLYSPDGTAPWRQWASGLNALELTIDFDRVAGSSGTARIQVLASDGVRTGSCVSNAFSVPMHLPSARITSPVSGTLFRPTELIWLQGYAFDIDDGFRADASLSWDSDLQGALGTGDDLFINTLVEGTHVITLTATDSAGNTASDSITIEVADVPIIEDFMSPGQLQFAQAQYMADETGGVFNVTVERVLGDAGVVTVNYATEDDSAIAGQDYLATSGQLVFEDGQLTATFEVEILDDVELESTESFVVLLSTPTAGAVLGAQDTAEVQITDDDTPNADDFVVTNTNDSGAGSLRQAIADANASPGLDFIKFNIPGAGVQTISPLSQLPTITDPVVINGYTQPGSSVNTADEGSDAVLLIELDGSNATGAARGLFIATHYCTVRGLVINSFSQQGIRASNVTGLTGLTVDGCFIGTDPSGMLARPNNSGGLLLVNTLNATVGGATPAARNLISGNLPVAIDLNNCDQSVIQGNVIGLGADGTTPLGNGNSGININGSDNLIGGLDPGAGNVIAYNANPFGSGIRVGSGVRNTLRSNRVFENGTSDIALADVPFIGLLIDPGDTDDGANLGQNYPILRSASSLPGGLTIEGILDSAPNTVFELEFFSSPTPNPSGFGGGKTVLGLVTMTTAAGPTAFSVILPVDVPQGHVISATATDPAGNTSGFSERIAVGDVLDEITVVNVVDDTDDGICDSTHCSLREAIHECNIREGHGFIHFNIPGPGVHTIVAQLITPCLCDDVTIDGFTQPGASPNTLTVGNDAVYQIEFNGEINSSVHVPGFIFRASNSTLRGLVVNRSSVILRGEQGNVVEGNFIGTDPTGFYGGLEFPPGQGLGNYIGVWVFWGSDNRIGGTNPASRNLISANIQFGIRLTSSTVSTVIQGNYIGTTRDGLECLGNGFGLGGGIDVTSNGGMTVIGGTEPGAGNLISCSDGDGIVLNGNGTVVQGNIIGPDVTGARIIDPFLQLRGIVAGRFGGSNNLIGGTDPAASNIISGNRGTGIELGTNGSNNMIQGNYIGTDATGLVNVGNGASGIRASGLDQTIGGVEGGAANVIAHNGQSGLLNVPCNTQYKCGGVVVERIPAGPGAGTEVAILSNSIFANNVIGIDLGSDGPTPNDPDDADDPTAGGVPTANHFQNYPVISTAELDGSGGVVVTYLVDSAPIHSAYPLLVQFFEADAGNNQGRVLLGSDSYPENSAQLDRTIVLANVQILGLNANDRIVGTATDADGNTSEFSDAVDVSVPKGCNGVCVWDTHFDGDVSASDLAELLGCWGLVEPEGPLVCACLDADGNGDIAAADLAELLGAWGPCP